MATLTPQGETASSHRAGSVRDPRAAHTRRPVDTAPSDATLRRLTTLAHGIASVINRERHCTRCRWRARSEERFTNEIEARGALA